MKIQFIYLQLILILLVVFQNCQTKPIRVYNNTIVGFSQRVKIPLIKPNGSISYFVDTTNIYYYDKFVLFETQIQFDSSYDNELITSKIVNGYFLFDTSCSNGVYHSAISEGEFKVKKVDSFTNLKITKLLSIDKNLVINTTQKSLSSEMVTKFILLKSNFADKIDSVILTYKRMNQLFNYSISPKYDNFDQLKLVSYNLIFNLPPDSGIPSHIKFNSSVEVSELGEFGPNSQIFITFTKLRNAYSTVLCK